jgi:uncharacterized protein DUF4326
MPIRVQRKRQKGWRKPPQTVYVGRPSAWENPFVVGKDGTAEECIQKYLDYLLPYRHHGKNSGMDKFYLSEMHFRGIKEELAGKNLMCWCPLDKPCHADALLKIANE